MVSRASLKKYCGPRTGHRVAGSDRAADGAAGPDVLPFDSDSEGHSEGLPGAVS